MDLQIRAISNKHNIKISIVDISESMREICSLQKTDPLTSFVLSKFTIANTLVAIDNKKNNKITTTYSTNLGSISRMVTELENNNIRSSVKNKKVAIDKIDSNTNPLDIILGIEGEIFYLRDMGLKKPYASSIKTKSSNIDHMFIDFLKESSQINSLITTDVVIDEEYLVEKVVGILIQLLPNHTDEDINYLENKIGNTNFINNILIKSTNYYEVIKDIVEDAEILESSELNFNCTCDYKKTLNSVLMLGKNEIKQIIEKKEPLMVVCDFCNKEYKIKVQDLSEMLK